MQSAPLLGLPRGLEGAREQDGVIFGTHVVHVGGHERALRSGGGTAGVRALPLISTMNLKTAYLYISISWHILL